MAQALGFVTQNDVGNYQGTFTLGGSSPISIVANDNKQNETQPDFRIIDALGQELGGGWNRVGATSQKEYISLTFAHPSIGSRKVYANLGPAYGKDEGEYAILWNPRK